MLDCGPSWDVVASLPKGRLLRQEHQQPRPFRAVFVFCFQSAGCRINFEFRQPGEAGAGWKRFADPRMLLLRQLEQDVGVPGSVQSQCLILFEVAVADIEAG